VTERYFSSQAELEGALYDLAAFIEYPAEPALAPEVRRRIEAAPDDRRQKTPLLYGLLASLRRPAFAAVAAIVAVCVLFIAWPTGRVAVANWLGLEDVRITYEEPPRGAGSELSLGEQKTLFEAQARVDFDILVPQTLGEPDVVYYGPLAGGMVNLVYEAQGDLRAAPGTDVGLIVTEFRSRLDEEFLLKYVPQSANVEEVSVRGQQGYWIDEPHELTYVDQGGEFGRLRNRLSAPSLVWQENSVVYRIEADVSRERAIAIAESLR
jgi:hypothetical protein